jgi:hypothetical protein
VEVERERRVAGEVFFKKGHMDFDWRSTASMIAVSNLRLNLRLVIVFRNQYLRVWERR